MLDIATVLADVAAFLVVISFCQPLSAYLKLSPPVLLGVVGVVLGALPALFSHLEWFGRGKTYAQILVDLPISSSTFIYVFLPLLVFEAGITTDVRRTLEDAAPILMLAVVATLVSTAITGLALWPLAGVPLVVCVLLGAVVAPTDPAAIIAIFRDLGAPARLTRLVEGEALLNDAAAIALFSVVLGMIVATGKPEIGAGLEDFFISFVGGGVLGVLAGRVLVWIIPLLNDDRLAEVTLTVALAYGVFIAAERLFHVSGVVAVLGSGLTLSALGHSRITPHNWSFLTDLWEQTAFWARSLIFILASIFVPRLFVDVKPYDLLLVAVLVIAAIAARVLVLFVMMPPLEFFKLSQPISSTYKITMAWGGLRGAVTLVLALAVTENNSLDPEVKRFVGLVATGFVLFTLFVNGTTLRPLIALLGLDRLSPRNQALRDRVLALSYAKVSDSVGRAAQQHRLPDTAVEQVIEPYQAWIAAANAREQGEWLSQRDRLAIALVALANQERAVVLEGAADRAASPVTTHVLLRNVDALIEAARAEGRVGYRRAAEQALSFPVAFRIAYFLYRHFGIKRFLAIRLAERVELLLATRLVIDRVLVFNDERLTAIFEPRILELTGEIIGQRAGRVRERFDALQLQYPDYVAALEIRFLHHLALREELSRYQSLFEDGLIPQELYDDLKRGITATQADQPRLRFEIGLEAHRLIEKLEILSGLDERELGHVARLLRPRFTVPDERIIRKGEQGDAVYFIATGEVEVRLPREPVRLGSGEFFGEMALLTGLPRQADVVALTYCRLLVLRRADFERFIEANPKVKTEMSRVAEARLAMNQDDGNRPREAASL